MSKKTLPGAPEGRPCAGVTSHILPRAFDRWNSGVRSAAQDTDAERSISVYDAIGQDYWSGEGVTARRMAGALRAMGMLLLTDVRGVLDANGDLIRQMTLAEAREAIASGVATGGMIPKLETAIAAVESGVEAVVILDGRRPHAMLTELFTEHGSGTLIRA